LINQQLGIGIAREQYERFALDLLKKHGDLDPRRAELFHVLIGSGMESREKVPNFDLKGDDSIVAFFRQLAQSHGIPIIGENE
jgi:hypothetical protein